MSSPLQLSDVRILDFYKKHPHLNVDAMNLIFIDLYEKMFSTNENFSQNNQTKYSNCINDAVLSLEDTTVNKQANLIVLLNKLYSTAEVAQLKDFDHTVFSMKRFQKPQILFESHDSDFNITSDEIQQFTKMVGDHNCNGVFISNKSGISSKPNYHIDFIHGNLLVFLHNVDYSTDKIKLAIDIIDTISVKLRELNNTPDENTIPKPVLDDINKEYQLFISQKEALINIYKECQKKVLSQIDEIRFPCLDKFLSTKYVTQIQKPGFKCDLCKCFNANNLKALAAHKRGCVRKNVFISVTSVPKPITN